MKICLNFKDLSFLFAEGDKFKQTLNPETKRFTTIPNHAGDLPEETLRAILKQAVINADEFPKLK